jgi:hypothetical protein
VALAALPMYAHALPEPQQQGAVSFVSGGVGEDELADIKGMARGYPLELLFVAKSTPTNEYVSDVQVKVMDKGGTVMLDTQSNGPYLLAKLPPGRYTIEATLHGNVRHQTVQLSSSAMKHLTFMWDNSVASMD